MKSSRRQAFHNAKVEACSPVSVQASDSVLPALGLQISSISRLQKEASANPPATHSFVRHSSSSSLALPTGQCEEHEDEGDRPTAQRPARLLYWHTKHNQRTWMRALRRGRCVWKEHGGDSRGFFVTPHDDGIGLALVFGKCPDAHNKRAFYEQALQAPASLGLMQFLPETYLHHHEYFAAAGPEAEKFQDAANSTGACRDLWFFKEAQEDNGVGVHALSGQRSLEEILAIVAAKETNGKHHKRGIDAIQPDGLPNGVFQRFVPNLMLWNGHKFDLRVYSTFDPFSGEPFCFSIAAVRMAPKPFNAASSSRTVQMTHYSAMTPTTRWSQWPEVMPGVCAAVAAVMKAFTPHVRPPPGPWASLWGVDVAIDAGLRPYILEVNTAPELTYGAKFPHWQGVVDSMLDDYLKHFVVPFLTSQPRPFDPTAQRGGWVCAPAVASNGSNGFGGSGGDAPKARS